MKYVQDAIAKLQAEQGKLMMAIAALKHLNNFADANGAEPARKKKRFTKATREKMALAQKRRWAQLKQERKRG